VASERQIEANRRNAGKSTGPRSAAGKSRAGRNAFRHGLTLSLTSSGLMEKQIEKLSCKIAGRTKNAIALRFARDAATAGLELERIRKLKLVLIERVLAFGSSEPTDPFGSGTKSIRYLKRVLAGKAMLEEPVDPLASLPLQEPQRSAEALRRALPSLLSLDRYEGRAISRRDRAIKQMIQSRE
jgi:hypothetical protein